MSREIDKSTPAHKEMPHYEGTHIPIDVINVLNQPRQTFRDIPELAQDIARKNILNPLTVAELNHKEADEYVDTINAIWGTKHEIGDLKPTPDESGQNKYYILIAGERRLKAFKVLATEGCFDCQETYGKGSCSKKHPLLFKDGDKVEVRLMRNFDAITAIDTQASENTHHRPAPEEEAHFYDRFYRLKKSLDSTYTISRFARDVGKSPDTISSALKFCRLPDEIQKYVRDGTISYGVAIELQRARETLSLDEHGLKYWLLKAIAEKYSVSDFSKRVSAEIAMKSADQETIGFWTPEEEVEMDRKHRKKVIAQHMVLGMWDFVKYFRNVQGLFNSGELGTKDSPFSIRSPLRIFKALVIEEKNLLPHLKNVLNDIQLLEANEVIKESENLISTLDSTAPDTMQIFPELPN